MPLGDGKMRAIGVKRLTGMKSDAIRMVAHNAIAITAPQAGTVTTLPMPAWITSCLWD